MTIPNALSQKPSRQKGDRNAAREIVQGRSERTVRRERGSCCGCCYMLIGLVIVSFAVAGVVLYTQYTRDNDLHAFHDGDQVLAGDVASDLNSVLCEAYTVTTANRANVYLTNGPAKVSPSVLETIRIRNVGLRAETEFDYRGFHLLPGSRLEIGACMSVFNHIPRVHAEVIIIKGEKHFQRWKNDASCQHCIHKRGIIPPEALCEYGNAVLTQYVIDHKDTYYVIITRQHRAEDDVAFTAEIDMKVIKTMYDTSDVKQECVNTKSCTLDLTYNAQDDVIVEFAFPDYSHPEWDTSFTSSCELRRNFWIPVFALVPGGLIALFLVVACAKSCLDQGKARKIQEKKDATKRVFAQPEDKKVPPV